MIKEIAFLTNKIKGSHKTIILIGFMGSGKSTLGKELSNILALPFCETDSQVEKNTGISISQIFELKGEDYFRGYEREVLLSIPKSSVISTGGGIVEDYENRQFLKGITNIVIWLDLDWEVILRRIEYTDRPKVVALNPQKLHELWFKRRPLYQECADITYRGNSVAELIDLIGSIF